MSIREPILFPDIEELVVIYLASKLSVPVGTKIPQDRPSSFVVCRRTGGTRRNLVIDRASIQFHCWADTDANALALAQLTRAYIFAILGEHVNGSYFYDMEESAGPGDLPDGVSNQSRYVFTFALSVRGVAL